MPTDLLSEKEFTLSNQAVSAPNYLPLFDSQSDASLVVCHLYKSFLYCQSKISQLY